MVIDGERFTHLVGYFACGSEDRSLVPLIFLQESSSWNLPLSFALSTHVDNKHKGTLVWLENWRQRRRKGWEDFLWQIVYQRYQGDYILGKDRWCRECSLKKQCRDFGYSVWNPGGREKCARL